jgi:RNA recognition motif-containing protein
MNTKVYVGKLSTDTTESELRELFAPHGTVAEVILPTDRATGRPRGFAFVTMTTPEGAQAAIQALNGKAIGASTIAVSEARPR